MKIKSLFLVLALGALVGSSVSSTAFAASRTCARGGLFPVTDVNGDTVCMRNTLGFWLDGKNTKADWGVVKTDEDVFVMVLAAEHETTGLRGYGPVSITGMTFTADVLDGSGTDWYLNLDPVGVAYFSSGTAFTEMPDANCVEDTPSEALCVITSDSSWVDFPAPYSGVSLSLLVDSSMALGGLDAATYDITEITYRDSYGTEVTIAAGLDTAAYTSNPSGYQLEYM